MDHMEERLKRKWNRTPSMENEKVVREMQINRWFGIELKLSEKIALKYYLTCFNNLPERTGIYRNEEAFMRFMFDYFGLNLNELGEGYRKFGKNEKREFEHGMHLLGTPEFKQYCREHVQMWRDERELI